MFVEESLFFAGKLLHLEGRINVNDGTSDKLFCFYQHQMR